MATDTEIRIVLRRLSQAADPLPRAGMVKAIADQTYASPERIEAVMDADEAGRTDAGDRTAPGPGPTAFAGSPVSGHAMPAAPVAKDPDAR